MISPVFLHCSLSQSLSRSNPSTCTLKFLRIVRVVSPLLIVFVGWEGSLWVLAVLQFFGNYGLPDSMGVRICRNHIQTTLEILVFPIIFSHWYRAYLCLTSFIGRILLNYHLNKARHDLWSIGDAYCNLVWWIGLLVY